MKIYYLEIIKKINPVKWSEIYEYMKKTQKPKYEKPVISKTTSFEQPKKSTGGGELKRTVSVFENKEIRNTVSAGIQITTEDAFTLTDGPSIFLTEDVKKIAHFYIQQTKIPSAIFQEILQKIARNNELTEKISALERVFEDIDKIKESSDKTTSKKDGKMIDLDKQKPEIRKMHKELLDLRSQIKYISLDSQYIPNTNPHQVKWAPNGEIIKNAFIPNIDEQVVRDIMALEIEDYQKVLLLMGIGLFMEDLNPRYLEIMKKLAYSQHLFLIIASSDYIYGTNYSFCHGFIAKDLNNMTQQKTLQSLGRIGRNNIQQTYTVRFRDDSMLMNLFMKQTENLEATNMSKLFSSD
jgi:hypothetical protein